MTKDGFKRKLTTILSADVVGYSRLMEDNEEVTIQTLNAYRNSISTLIQQYRGLMVDMTGDNLMAEFSSVVDAVKCAVESQNEISKRNADLPKNRQMLFRIGINLGDIVEEDDRIYGDGVNIAARLEGLAESGGICISGTAYDQLKNKLELGYEYLGEHRVKNIAEQVRVYRVLMEPESAGKVVGEKRFLGKLSRKTALTAIIILVIIAGGLIGWNIYLQQSNKVEPASIEKMAFPLPDKPSIAVLPFDNISGDPEQEYFSDGLTEDIITDLAKISGMFVIARHSSFRYKGKSVNVKQVGQELGVRYLLEGSVRKSGDRVRINAQLVDTINGYHLWSERYDREQKDLFKLQNEILNNIVTALDVKLVEGEQANLYRKATDNPEAYDAFAKGFGLFRQFSKDANSLAKQYLSKAVELDPKYAAAMAILSATHWADARFGWSGSRSQSIEKGKELALKALAIDKKSYNALSALSTIHLLEKDYDRAMEVRKQAFSINPNSADSNAMMALTLSLVNREEEALPYIKTAMRLSPFYPSWYLSTLCDIYRLMGRYDEAIAVAKTIIDLNLPHEIEIGRLYLAAILIELGRSEEARKLAAEYKKLRPTFTLSWFKRTRIYKDPQVTEKFISQLREAGFPD
jgi:TolB-like protein/class 3 adenylate cyclase